MKRRDNDGQGAADSLSEQDERLLSALFDGEISRDEIAKRVAEPVLAQSERELDGLRELRREIRGWHAARTQNAEGKPLQIDVWARIKDQVQEQAKAKRAPSSLDFIVRIREAIFGSADGAETLWGVFSRPAYVGGAFAAAAAFGLALYSAGSPEGPSFGTTGQVRKQLAMNAPEVVTVARSLPSAGAQFGGSQFSVRNASVADSGQGDGRGEQFIGELGDEPPADVLAMMNESEEQSRRRYVPPLPDSLKVRLLSPQMVADSTAVGLRTSSGADIDWIRSSKPFKIVAAQGYSAPPVIWVASKKGR